MFLRPLIKETSLQFPCCSKYLPDNFPFCDLKRFNTSVFYDELVHPKRKYDEHVNWMNFMVPSMVLLHVVSVLTAGLCREGFAWTFCIDSLDVSLLGSVVESETHYTPFDEALLLKVFLIPFSS